MTIVNDGVIRHLSVSKVEMFDHSQRGGCELRWWFNAVKGRHEETGPAKEDGTIGHGLLAEYFRTGKPPEGRVKMGKAVRAAIAGGAELPTPRSNLMVESRFDGQAQRDADGKWIDLDTDKTFWLGGLPWDGAIDLRWRNGDVGHVLDHKFSSDIDANAKQAGELIKTVQLPVYVLDSLRLPEWQGLTRFSIGHHNVSRTGEHSFIRSAVVPLDQVLERKEQIETVVGRMKQVAHAELQGDVPFNRKSCETWSGCPHQSRCKAFLENRMPPPSLSAEELALFGDFETPAPAVVAPPSPIPAATPENDPGIPPPPTPDRKLTIKDIPSCAACGTTLTAENGSQLRAGEWKHIGCPTEATPVIEKPKRGRPAKPPDTVPAPPVTTPAPVAEIGTLMPLQPQTIRLELGPETLAALKAMLAR